MPLLLQEEARLRRRNLQYTVTSCKIDLSVLEETGALSDPHYNSIGGITDSIIAAFLCIHNYLYYLLYSHQAGKPAGEECMCNVGLLRCFC